MDLALAKRRAVRRDAKTASGGAAEMDADMSHRAAGAARERAWGEESEGMAVVVYVFRAWWRVVLMGFAS